MNRVEGDLSLEAYEVVKMTCGHLIYVDLHSGPKKDSALKTEEHLIYCTKCGHYAQVARIQTRLREVQVVTNWQFVRDRIARDNDPYQEYVRLRKTPDAPAGATGQPDSPGDSGVPGSNDSDDSAKGIPAGGTPAK